LDLYGPGIHFRCTCNQCNGWGYVDDDLDKKCLHETKELTYSQCKERGITHFGMCWHVYECIHCGKIFSYDSSD